MIEQNNQLCLSYPIWIVGDVKYYAEIEFFKKHFNDRLLIVRIEASDSVRKKRGWNFQNNIDNTESECQLDKYDQWSFIFVNNEEDSFNEQINNLTKIIDS